MANRVRSPAYPSITIDDAVERARVLYKIEGKHPTLAQTAASHWGYKPRSSGGLKTIAALKAYGLLDAEGSGATRKVAVSGDGLKIVMDERADSPERESKISDLAIKPKILAEMWNLYGTNLPSNDTIKHFLVVERDYNPNAVDDIIKVYRSAAQRRTAAIMSEFDDISDEQKAPNDESTAPTGGEIPMKQDTFTLDEGNVTIQWPSKLSEASFEDLTDWLEIMARKMKRAVTKENDEETGNI